MSRSPMAYGPRDWDHFRIHDVVTKGFELPRDLKRAKRGRTEQRYLKMTAQNAAVRRALLASSR